MSSTDSQSGWATSKLPSASRPAQQAQPRRASGRRKFFQRGAGFRRGEQAREMPDPDRIGGSGRQFLPVRFFHTRRALGGNSSSTKSTALRHSGCQSSSAFTRAAEAPACGCQLAAGVSSQDRIFPAKIFAIEFRKLHQRIVLEIAPDAFQRRADGRQSGGDVFHDLGDKRAVRAGGFLVRHDAHVRAGKVLGDFGVRSETRRFKFEIAESSARVAEIFPARRCAGQRTGKSFPAFSPRQV